MASPNPQGKREEKAAMSIVRIAGKDVDGRLSLQRALESVKGLGHNMSHALSQEIESKLGIAKSTSVGALDEASLSKIEKALKDPVALGIPSFMLNRRKDFETGNDLHLVGSDLTFATRQDISREVSLRTWKGYRHQYGQRVRGQHTRSTGRKGATVGVTKKAIIAQQKAAIAGGAKDKEKK